MELITHTTTETKQAGAQFGATLTGGEVVYLYGDLGAGKTTFVQGVAQALGVTHDITSPTFTILSVYPAQHPRVHTLVHVDTYRLHSAQELVDIGIEEYVGKPDCTVLVEWPDKTESLFDGKKIVRVTLEHTDAGARRITTQE